MPVDRAEPIPKANVRRHKSVQYLLAPAGVWLRPYGEPTVDRFARLRVELIRNNIGKQRQLVPPALLEFVARRRIGKVVREMQKGASALLGKAYRDERSVRRDRAPVTNPYVNTICCGATTSTT